MDATVSVYIPTRNRRPLLQRAVASVLRQTHRNIQVVVVDDASTDDTREYLEDLVSREPRVSAMHMERPSGAPAARNLAIRESCGDFVTGLDDDDEFRNDRIELFLSRWRAEAENGASFSCLFSESVMISESGVVLTTDRKDDVEYPDLFAHNYIGNQVFCPREYVLRVGGFDESLPAWQDLDTFMRLVKRFGKARRVEEPTYICHVERDRGRISTDPTRLRLAFDRISTKHVGVPEEWKHAMYLQMFSPFYGVAPTLGDWRNMLAWRANPKLLAKLLRATVRNRLK